MLNILRVERARLQLSLWRMKTPTDELEPVSQSAGVYQPEIDELVYLRARVTNLSGQFFRHVDVTHHLIAIAAEPQVFVVNMNLDPFQHILAEGVLSDIPVGRLGSGQTYEFDTPVTFVSCGRFEVSGVIRDPGQSGDSDRLGRGLLKAMVRP